MTNYNVEEKDLQGETAITVEHEVNGSLLEEDTKNGILYIRENIRY